MKKTFSHRERFFDCNEVNISDKFDKETFKTCKALDNSGAISYTYILVKTM